jgi:hypothetical protein
VPSSKPSRAAQLALLSSSNIGSSTGEVGVGPHCSFCGTFTGPFSEVEGLFTVLICIPCLEVRQAQPDTLLGLHDPADPWEQWGCPIQGCGKWFNGPWYLEWHTPRLSIPAGRPPMSCCGPTRTSACGSCTGGSRTRPVDWSASTRTTPRPSRTSRTSRSPNSSAGRRGRRAGRGRWSEQPV